MKIKKIGSMKIGWFIGDFFPNLVRREDMEVALKRYQQGQLDCLYYHKENTEFYIVVSGKIKVDNRIFTRNDIIILEPYEDKKFVILEDTCCVVIRTPGIKKDKYISENLTLSDVLSVYSESIQACKYGSVQQKEKIGNKDSKIDYKDISVVVQGAIDKSTTPICLQSIRKFLPQATIILSTWEGSDVSGLEYDELILTEDVGTEKNWIETDFKNKNNTNRQIVSTQEGLKKVKTKYVLKLRSDLILTGNDFINYFDKYKIRSEKYKLFESRLLIGEMYTRKTLHYMLKDRRRSIPTPFHPSDWFYFGYSEDVRKFIAETKLIDNGDYNNCVVKNKDLKKQFHPDARWDWKYYPEQYICYSAFKRKFNDISFSDFTDVNSKVLRVSREFLLNNFVPLSFVQSGIVNRKYQEALSWNNGNKYIEKGLLTNNEFLKYYRELSRNV